MSTSSSWSAARTTGSGTALAPGPPRWNALSRRIVERLQVPAVPCAEMNVDPGVAGSSSTSCQRLAGVVSGRIGVGQLVHQHQFGLSTQQPVEIHLLQRLAPVFRLSTREYLEVAEIPWASVWGRPCSCTQPITTVGAPFLPTPAFIGEHWRRSSRPRGQRRDRAVAFFPRHR